MSYTDRLEIYQEIETLRQKPLITYVTSTRQSATGVMSSDVISEFTSQLLQIPADKTEIDLLVVSNGGDPTVSWRINSLLRERFEKVSVLLPYSAFSAATLLGLGAD